MKKTERSVEVWMRDSLAGILSETEEGYSFVYDEAYLEMEGARPVSLTLPLSGKAFESTILFPFFDGLIPEGWLLDTVSRNWKINRSDRFGLLGVACSDTVGAVSIRGGRL